MSDNAMYAGLLGDAVGALQLLGEAIDRIEGDRSEPRLRDMLFMVEAALFRFNLLQEVFDDSMEVCSVHNRTYLATHAINRSVDRVGQMHDVMTQMVKGKASDLNLLRVMSLLSTTLSVLAEVQWLLSSDLIEMYFLPNAG